MAGGLGWHVYNNSFYNCTTGTFIGGGSFNLIHDNYYEQVDTCQHFDARGMGAHGMRARDVHSTGPYSMPRVSCNASQPCVTTTNGGNCTCPAAAANHMLHGPAGAEWNVSWGTELHAVISDTRCINSKGALPCYSQVADNTCVEPLSLSRCLDLVCLQWCKG
jgi:hypothetical protein